MPYPTALALPGPPLNGPQFVAELDSRFGALAACWAGEDEPPGATDGWLWLDTTNAFTGPRLRVLIDDEWRLILSDVGLIVADCDVALTDGNFIIQPTTANSPFPGLRGAMLVLGRGGPVTQIATRQDVGEANLLWIRVSLDGNGNVWRPWRRVFTQADIIGTVGMVNGQPTGALFQTGANANGVYDRFASGTQICRARLDMSYVNAAALEGVCTFPARFADENWRASVLVRSLSSSVALQMLSTPHIQSAPTATQGHFMLRRVSGQTDFSPGDSALVHVLAIGAWT